MAISTLPKPDADYDADADEKYAPKPDLGAEPTQEQINDMISGLENMLVESAGESSSEESDSAEGGGGSEGKADSKESTNAPAEKKPDTASASDLSEAEQLGKGYTPDSDKKKKGIMGKIQNSSKAKKAAILLGAGTGGAGLILVLFLLLMLASMLKIPDLAQNINDYELERMSRQFADSAQESTNEAIALQGTDEETYTGLRAIYASGQDLKYRMWSKMLNYRPGAILKSLHFGNAEGLGALRYNYSQPDALGRQRLVSVSVIKTGDEGLDAILNGKDEYNTFPMADIGAARYVPGLRSIMKLNNDAQFWADFQDSLDNSLLDFPGQDIGPIVRGLVANQVRKELGISLAAWALSKFKDKTTEPEAEVEETEQRGQAVDQNADNQPDTSSGTDAIDKTTKAVEGAEATAATSDTAVQQAINNNGIFKSVQSALKTGLEESGLDEAASLLNPAEAIAYPICTASAAELNNSGSTIDKQTTQEQSAYYYVASAADQEKAGVMGTDPDAAQELDAAVGGLNDSLGNTMNSNAYIRANGDTVSTSGTLSAEASAGGQFTLADALFGSNAISSMISTITNAVCPIMTNPGLAAALGAVNFASGLADFGSTPALEKTAATAAADATTTTVKSMFVNLITRYLGDNAGRAAEIVYDTGQGTIKSAISLAAITIMARLVVTARAGQMFSGFSEGTDLANEADAGGNLQGSELERVQLFGRPMTETEVCQSNQIDAQDVYAQEASRSAYDRYLSPDYADSLLSRTAVMFGDDFNTSYTSGLLNTVGSTLFRPLTSLGWLSSLFIGKTFADATTDCNDNVTDYGNVQFGWSQDEENLIQSNVTYEPLENEQILTDSGQEAAIAQKYAVCFGYKYNANGNGDFDPTDANGDLVLNDGPDDDGSIGTLLSLGLIIRDQNGNVIDAGDTTGNYGLCSPDNLSYNSTDPLAADPDSASPKYRDMIFRFRLAMRYDTTMDQLSNMQSISSD
ncbi:MAG TPA: hypothetical protein VMB52_01165 [Verrucomicrobiae bacterium]|nr:hypothetical protein [Verrucomicrobiae bacterium]